MINYNTKIYLLIVSVILLTVILISMFYYFTTDVSNTDISKVNKIHDLLQQVTCELDRNDIAYIITGGTLLGSIRQNGMIPWDDDGDIAILVPLGMSSDELLEFKQKIKDCLRLLKKNNINTYEHILGNIFISHFEGDGSCVDIFFLSSGDDNIYRYLEPFGTRYSNEYYIHSDIFPITEYTFGPITLKGPNNPYDFLDRAYPNWKTLASKWNHFRYVPLNSNQTKFQPILPDTLNKKFPWIKKECTLN